MQYNFIFVVCDQNQNSTYHSIVGYVASSSARCNLQFLFFLFLVLRGIGKRKNERRNNTNICQIIWIWFDFKLDVRCSCAKTAFNLICMHTSFLYNSSDHSNTVLITGSTITTMVGRRKNDVQPYVRVYAAQ